MKMNLTMIAETFEDEDEIRTAMNGSRYKSVISDLLEWLRSNYKYSKGDIPEGHALVVRDWIYEALKEWNLEP